MELLKENWNWIVSNPWGFATMSVLLLGAGWAAAKMFYSERIELLKARASGHDSRSADKPTIKKFQYRPIGRHGRNVLADTTHDATVGDPMSLQAEIPDGEKLHVVMRGPPPSSLSPTLGAWYYSVIGVANWAPSTYKEDTSSSTQHFNAEVGQAEMKFTFNRTGDVVIEAFEGETRKPSWSKTIHVSAKG
jgi:hypothetical protein